MNNTETLALFKVIKTVYPNFLKGMTQDEIKDTACMWTEMFSDDDTQMVCVAVKSYINSDETGYAPNIGKIKGIMRKLNPSNTLTPQEAWDMVYKAIDYYDSTANFNKLPEDIQKVLGSSRQLQIWALEDISSIPVNASNFMRSYTEYHRRKEEVIALPSSVRQMLQGNLLEG